MNTIGLTNNPKYKPTQDGKFLYHMCVWNYDKNEGIKRTRRAYITEAIISMKKSYLCYYTLSNRWD